MPLSLSLSPSGSIKKPNNICHVHFGLLPSSSSILCLFKLRVPPSWFCLKENSLLFSVPSVRLASGWRWCYYIHFHDGASSCSGIMGTWIKRAELKKKREREAEESSNDQHHVGLSEEMQSFRQFSGEKCWFDNYENWRLMKTFSMDKSSSIIQICFIQPSRISGWSDPWNIKIELKFNWMVHRLEVKDNDFKIKFNINLRMWVKKQEIFYLVARWKSVPWKKCGFRLHDCHDHQETEAAATATAVAST